MKYLKKFEVFNEDFTNIKYDVNDYIILTKDIMEYFDIKSKYNKIIKKSSDFYYLEGVGFEKNPVADNDIIRKMTEEEIKQYELEKSASKYNI